MAAKIIDLKAASQKRREMRLRAALDTASTTYVRGVQSGAKMLSDFGWREGQQPSSEQIIGLANARRVQEAAARMLTAQAALDREFPPPPPGPIPDAI